jgi:hypothetical protein
MNGPTNKEANSDNQKKFTWKNLKPGTYKIQGVAKDRLGARILSNIETVTLLPAQNENHLPLYLNKSELKLNYTDSLVGFVEYIDDNKEKTIVIRSNSLKDYSMTGQIILQKAKSINKILPLDEFRVKIKIVKNPTYITFRFNDNWQTDINVYLPASTSLNAWFTYYYALPKSLINTFGKNISSVQLIHENIGEVFVQDLEFVQTDGGSFSPKGTPVSLAGRPQVPANSVFRGDISKMPVLKSKSQDWLNSIGGFLHPDFGDKLHGNLLIYGIPFNIDDTAKAPKIVYTPYLPDSPNLPKKIYYHEESDLLPQGYPFRPSYSIEYGPDKHLIVVDSKTGDLYEQWNSFPVDPVPPSRDYPSTPPSPFAMQGTFWNLNSNACRTPNITSADAAGLPIYPLLLTYDDVAKGDLQHMLRFTKEEVYGVIWPASHKTGGTNRSLNGVHSDAFNSRGIPFGAILRLKSSFNISGFSDTNQRILRGLKKHGMILADNGGNGFISGTPDKRWNEDDLNALKKISIPQNFEVVDIRSQVVRPTSYEIKYP